MQEKKLYAIIFEEESIIYWKRIKTLEKNEKYEVFLNDKKIGTTKKTHFTCSNLIPNNKYVIKVKLSVENQVVFSDTIQITTKQKPVRIDVTKPPYNAIGDGKTLNTKALQRALDDCKEGECVYFPQGKYVSGGLFVHSNTNIYVEEGAVLQGSQNPENYLPKIKSRFEGIEQMCYQSLLNIGELDHTKGCTTENICIYGKGSIFGGGSALHDNILKIESVAVKEYLDSLSEEELKTFESNKTVALRARGRLMQIANCENVVISGLNLGYSPAWNVHFIYSNNIITTGCKFFSMGVNNGDGWDPDSSTNCVLFDCVFDTHDDSVAIKSGKNPEGNIINRPTENVNVFDCRAICGNAFAIGSEMSGGVKDVFVWDCDIENTWFGLQIKSAEKRGGYIQNVQVYDSIVGQVRITGTVGYNNDGEGAKTYAKLSDFHFENVYITGTYNKKGELGKVAPITISGLDKDGCEIQNVIFENCKIKNQEDGQLQNINIKRAKNINMKNLSLY